MERVFASLLPSETGNEQAFFTQERYGDPNADPITIEKLITLSGTPDNGSSATGMRHDRAGKCGTLARKWRADELRQLLPVLKGDLALIGPRPVTWTDIKKYYEAIDSLKATEHAKQQLRLDWEDARRTAKPGVAANWSCSQYDPDYTLDPLVVVEYDIAYARHASLGGDMLILNDLLAAAGKAALRGVSANLRKYSQQDFTDTATTDV